MSAKDKKSEVFSYF